ncbi:MULTISPECIES: hypothetical protein [unclassified Novosphingobium]|uniref:hypothetical protein n=1 Tax=unclassified Novosphingobium TaxID=2644732 RepID=UPI0025D34F12|nr:MULTISPECIES: hypothetical protein [unclassified Novosphingobium]HQS69556.1 hypothetical protein [Novosphingobium sp.]
MGLAYGVIPPEVRGFMLEEIDLDFANGSIYISNYLNERGSIAWPDLLREAATNGNDDSLATAIRQNGYLKSHTQRRKPSGGFTTAAVPHTAHETMGEGEFNRYYTRGLCRFAIANGVSSLEVYRAKGVENPRPASQAKIGLLVDPSLILADLRVTQGVEPALGLPPGPNSGLTLRIPS